MKSVQVVKFFMNVDLEKVELLLFLVLVVEDLVLMCIRL